MRKKIILEVGPKASKALLALGKIQNSLNVPIENIGNFIQTVSTLQKQDPSNEELKALLDKLREIVAYVGGAGNDLLQLKVNLRNKKEIVAKLDSNLPDAVTEAIRREVRRVLHKKVR